MDFYRMQGCGNRFAIFDGRAEPVSFRQGDIGQIAGAGVDIDQVIVIESSLKAEAFMRIWNRDGSSAAACGNATRCVGWLLMREKGGDRVSLESEAGLLHAEARGEHTIAVDMGAPLLGWEEIPLAERMDTRGIDLKFGPIDDPFLHSPGAVNMGNPHVVFFVEALEAIDVEGIGPMVEGHMLFPQRTNAGFAQVLSPDAIRLRVWERGAGLTPACGSGACAALVAACRKGLTGREADVAMDGGSLHIHWRESDDHVIQTGPVELTAKGRL